MMNAVVTINPETRSLGPQLPALLAETVATAIRERVSYSELPVISPEAAAAVPAAIAEVERCLQGASPDRIAAILGTISFALPKRQSDADATAMLEVYIQTLSDIPDDILAEAGIKAVQTLKFFPKVAELRELAMPEVYWRRSIIRRLNQLREKHVEEYREPIPEEKLVSSADFEKLRKRLERRFPTRRT